MFRKQVNPKVAALATLLVLAGIQFVYWRLLVHQELDLPSGPPPTGEIFPVPPPIATGREDVTVDTWVGGEPGFRDGPSWQARFNGPNALALGPRGELYVTDSRNHQLRIINGQGQVRTVANTDFRYPSGVAVAADGRVFIADTGNHRIWVLQDGQVATLAGAQAGFADGRGRAARFEYPAAMMLDEKEMLWVADLGSGRIRRVDGSGLVTTPEVVPPAVAEALGSFAQGSGGEVVYASPDGRFQPRRTEYVVGRHAPSVGPPGALHVFADLEHRTLMARWADGGALVLVSRRQSEGASVGSADGEGHRASFALPCAVVMAPNGTVYVADYEGNRIRRVRLPEWLLKTQTAPQIRRNRFRRDRRGR